MIVSTTEKVTIYDGDDPNLPMWMVFDTPGGNGINNVPLLQYGGQGSGYPTAALNGVLVLGERTSGDNWGNPIVNFISEYIVEQTHKAPRVVYLMVVLHKEMIMLDFTHLEY